MLIGLRPFAAPTASAVSPMGAVDGGAF